MTELRRLAMTPAIASVFPVIASVFPVIASVFPVIASVSEATSITQRLPDSVASVL